MEKEQTFEEGWPQKSIEEVIREEKIPFAHAFRGRLLRIIAEDTEAHMVESQFSYTSHESSAHLREG
jgi:hypothetical protein